MIRNCIKCPTQRVCVHVALNPIDSRREVTYMYIILPMDKQTAASGWG